MIEVLVVDDSALVRKVVSDVVNSAPDLHLAGTAMDPLFAVEKLKKLHVDVIVLDIEMPRMDGLTFLEKLMRISPVAVIMLSSLTENNAALALTAMETGAFEVITKPHNLQDVEELKKMLLPAIRSGASSDVKAKLKRRNIEHSHPSHVVKTVSAKTPFTVARKTTDKVILIGSSTGGTVCVEKILSAMPVTIPGIVVVQHLPALYSKSFAQRLNGKSSINVKLAEDGDRIINGTAYIAPGDKQCAVRASGAKYYIEITDDERVNYHRPSVEYLFNSAVKNVGSNAIGVMLTGMGEDGSKAMAHMKTAGSYNIVQDEKSSVVWGMPGKAVEYGAAHVVLPIDEIPDHICEHLS